MANPKTVARLEKRIKERVSYALQFELSDPRSSFVTVTSVDLSPDLALAKIYYSVLGSDSDRSKAEHMLQHASGFIRKQLGRVLETRNIPRLSWHYDASIEEAANLANGIAEARRRDEAIRGEEESAPEGGPAGPSEDADKGPSVADPSDG